MNIESKERKEIELVFKGINELHVNVFDKAASHVFKIMAFDSFGRFKYDIEFYRFAGGITHARTTPEGLAIMAMATTEQFPEVAQNSPESDRDKAVSSSTIVSSPLMPTEVLSLPLKGAALTLDAPTFDKRPPVMDLSAVSPDEWQNPDKQSFLYKKGNNLMFQFNIYINC